MKLRAWPLVIGWLGAYYVFFVRIAPIIRAPGGSVNQRDCISLDDETNSPSVPVLEPSGEDRENPHIVRELVRCGKASCRCAREQKHRHGPYLYLRYEEYDPKRGRFVIGANTFPPASSRVFAH